MAKYDFHNYTLNQVLDGAFGILHLLLCAGYDASAIAWTIAFALDELQLAAGFALDFLDHVSAFANHNAHRSLWYKYLSLFAARGRTVVWIVAATIVVVVRIFFEN